MIRRWKALFDDCPNDLLIDFVVTEAVKHSWEPNARILNSKKLATKNAKTQSPAEVSVLYSSVCLVWCEPVKFRDSLDAFTLDAVDDLFKGLHSEL